MRSSFLFSIFLLLTLEGIACGVMHGGGTARFYHLFRQDEVGPKPYADFLRDIYSRPFYSGSSDLKDPFSKNIHLWYGFLDGEFSKGMIQRALKSDERRVLEKEWEEKSPKKQAASDYIRYAKICSDAFAYRNSKSWDYGDILSKEQKKSIDKLIERGYKRFEEATIEQLKARYAYQIVRALHYSRRYDEAVNFFQKKVASEMERNEIYYYIMDQAAGCYYSLEEYEKAAYYFIRVFGNSYDRKRSAYNSYDLCLSKGADGSSLFNSQEERGIHLTIKALRNIRHDPDRILELYETDPDEDRLRLLFTRMIYDMEQKVWPKRVGRNADSLPRIEKGVQRRIERLDSICQVIRDDPKIDDQGYWGLAASYLRFLKGDGEKARERLEAVDEGRYKDQKKMLERIYEVFDWKEMDRQKEERLVEILQEEWGGMDPDQEPNLTLRERFPEHGYKEWRPAWKYLLLDHVGHLYYEQGRSTKAFLTHNDIRNTHELGSHRLVDELIAFFGKGRKSPFEKVLVEWSADNAKGDAPIAHLRYVKGVYYLKEAAPRQALAEFRKGDEHLIEQGKMDDFHPWKISGRVFSNNIKECFNCPEEEVMKDSVFIHDAYPFLNDEPIGVQEIASSLVKLDSMSEHAVEWKRKLAHYLKGNFYYNVTTTGYYRGALTGKSNCCNYQHRKTPDTYRETLEERPGYNLYGFHAPSLYHGLAKEAMREYDEVLSLSDDPELNARTLYMRAKCELSIMYSEGDRNWNGTYYKGELNDKTLPYKGSFEKLQRNYADTEFHEEIIERCAFFEQYVAERF